VLYRAAVEDVPVKEYTLPLGKADVLVTGKEWHVMMAFRVVVFSRNRLTAQQQDACALCSSWHSIHPEKLVEKCLSVTGIIGYVLHIC
jgi:pyruvate/2-oxoglutarate/acetoin dehydrogenase E1 component